MPTTLIGGKTQKIKMCVAYLYVIIIQTIVLIIRPIEDLTQQEVDTKLKYSYKQNLITLFTITITPYLIYLCNTHPHYHITVCFVN